jgi:hypothetical protein
MARKSAAPRGKRLRSASHSTALEAAVEATKRVLDEEARAHALIGGLAISARATPRFTDDVDFALSCSDADAEDLIKSFVWRGFTIDALLMTKSTNRIATVRLKPPRSEVLVDLLFDFTGIEREIVGSATAAVVHEGFTAPVATIAHLIAMKVLAFRKKDLVDLDLLFEVAASADLSEARRAVAAIARAGKEPKRDLSADLERLIAERELPSDELIEVSPTELAKRFGQKPSKKKR